MNRFKENNYRSIRIAILTILLVLTMASMPFTEMPRAESEDGEPDNRGEISIEVVEDLPAADIEEDAVPLAALPVSERENGVRHAGMMLALMVMVIAYSAYFVRYEKRIARLRKQAAEAEIQAMNRRRRTEDNR